MACTRCGSENSVIYVGNEIKIESKTGTRMGRLMLDNGKALCYQCREKFRDRVAEELDNFVNVQDVRE